MGGGYLDHALVVGALLVASLPATALPQAAPVTSEMQPADPAGNWLASTALRDQVPVEPDVDPDPMIWRADGGEDVWIPPRWEAITPEGIGPGTPLRIERPDLTGGCTANFVFENPRGQLYLGTAGHCVVPADRNATHGPDRDYDASRTSVEALIQECTVRPDTFVAGVPGCEKAVIRGLEVSPDGVQFGNASVPEDVSEWVPLGDVVYAHRGEIGRDFALVEIPAQLEPFVRPEMPRWGGPNGSSSAERGDRLLHYGHGLGWDATPLHRGRAAVMNGYGLVVGGWSALGGASPGDSGSGVVVDHPQRPGSVPGGPAMGVVTHGVGVGVSLPAGLIVGTPMGTATADAACWADLAVRVVPNGTASSGCPRPVEDTTGAHGTVLVQDLANDATFPPAYLDVRTVWMRSADQAITVTVQLEGLTGDQFRTRYDLAFDVTTDTDTRSVEVFCKVGDHEGQLPAPDECTLPDGTPVPVAVDLARDQLRIDIPYEAVGTASGDQITAPRGETFFCETHPPEDGSSCVGADSLEGEATHVLR